MLAAVGWAALAASSLLLGAILTLWLKPGQRLIGLIMAFGAGTLIAAIAYELVQDAAESGRPTALAAGLAFGAVTFVVGDWLVDRSGGANRKRSDGTQADGDTLGILLGTLLDGIPESFILGSSMATGDAVSVSFLIAVFISNLPEAMGSVTGLVAAGWSKRRIIGLWIAVIGISALTAGVGYALSTRNSLDGVFAQSFAAGALLTMLADTMMPEAFEYGGRLVGLLTVFGFAVSFFLSQFT